jgi:hypothetical protein
MPLGLRRRGFNANGHLSAVSVVSMRRLGQPEHCCLILPTLPFSDNEINEINVKVIGVRHRTLCMCIACSLQVRNVCFPVFSMFVLWQKWLSCVEQISRAFCLYILIRTTVLLVVYYCSIWDFCSTSGYLYGIIRCMSWIHETCNAAKSKAVPVLNVGWKSAVLHLLLDASKTCVYVFTVHYRYLPSEFPACYAVNGKPKGA